MDNAHVCATIPGDEIRAAIEMAIYHAFTPKQRKEMLKTIIEVHLSAKKNSYSSTKETIIGEVVGEEMRKIAVEEVKKSINTKWDPEIRAVVRKAVEGAFMDNVMESFANAISKVVIKDFYVTARPIVDEE